MVVKAPRADGMEPERRERGGRDQQQPHDRHAPKWQFCVTEPSHRYQHRQRNARHQREEGQHQQAQGKQRIGVAVVRELRNHQLVPQPQAQRGRQQERHEQGDQAHLVRAIQSCEQRRHCDHHGLAQRGAAAQIDGIAQQVARGERVRQARQLCLITALMATLPGLAGTPRWPKERRGRIVGSPLPRTGRAARDQRAAQIGIRGDCVHGLGPCREIAWIG